MENSGNDDKKYTKYYLNNSEITQSLQGLAILNRNVTVYIKEKIVVNSLENSKKKVKLISGGGSGHEPAHSGFVCDGFLSACVCGEIFASPSYKNILKAIQIVEPESIGVLLLVKNYSGDVINFRLAMQSARQKGISVEMLVVDDDIAIKSESESFNSKRGLCGISLLYKILGGLSNSGFGLAELVKIGAEIISNTYTLNTSMNICNPPFSFARDYLSDDECEIGLGIHGEKGMMIVKFEKLDDILEKMLKTFEVNSPGLGLTTTKDNKEVVLVLNNLGSVTDIEMAAITYNLLNCLKKVNPGLVVLRLIHGKIMTSLDMKGFSLTFLDLTNTCLGLTEKDAKAMILESIDNGSHPEWRVVVKSDNDNYSKLGFYYDVVRTGSNTDSEVVENKAIDSKIGGLILSVLKQLMGKTDYLNQLDKTVGDGDLGISLGIACEYIIKNMRALDFDNQTQDSFIRLGELIADSYGGTSGPLFASFCFKISEDLKNNYSETTTREVWLSALLKGIKASKFMKP